jgi:hypothetical protein
MKTITSRLSLIVTLLIILISHLNSVHAEESKQESVADRIKSFTQKHHDKEEALIKQKSNKFIQDLKEKYPQFTQDHLESMARTFEESLLDKQTTRYLDKKDRNQSSNESKSVVKEVKGNNEKKETLQGKVKKLVNENAEEKKNIASQVVIDEAKITTVSLVVKDGDTLSDIAERTYGDSTMYLAIYEENKDQLSSPNAVPIGITLRVPKIDHSMKKKFKELQKRAKIKETKQPKLSQQSTAKSIDSEHATPQELNKLISEAVSAAQ